MTVHRRAARSIRRPRAQVDFLTACRTIGLPAPIAEMRFHPARRWRFDFAWPDHRVAIEIEGGVWTAGRHTRGQGFLSDIEKYNAAAELGWRLLRYPPGRVDIDQVARVLGARGDFGIVRLGG